MSELNHEDENDYEDICTICHRTESMAGKMYKLPNNFTVCEDCMHKTMDSLKDIDIEAVLNSPMYQNMPFMAGMPMDMMFDMPGGTTTNREKQNVAQDENANNGAPEVKATDSQENSDIEDAPQQKENPEEEEKKQNPHRTMPRFSFINLADMQGGFGGPKVKKKKKGEHKPLIKLEDIPAPHKIKALLDEYVVGQEYAKKVMSVAVYNHYKRVATDTMDEIEIEKSNMLMIGPTGCGKTYLVKTLAKLLNVPLAITDATTLTEAGYIGDDIESVVSKLLAAADNDVDKAEQGIIFIDEIDKIAKKKNTNSRDVSGESVQQGMLKLLEGADIEVPIGASSKNAMVPTTIVNTRNILFICGGAFPGLEDIIKERLSKQSSIGFSADLKDKFDDDKDLLKKVTVEDIRKFGMIPEFLGRLPMLFTMDSLSKEMLVDILKEPKNAILKQYQKLLRLDEVQLQFDEEALEAIADKAMETDTGARALRAVIEKFMLDIMFEIPKDDNIGTVTITKDYVEGTGGPKIELRTE